MTIAVRAIFRVLLASTIMMKGHISDYKRGFSSIGILGGWHGPLFKCHTSSIVLFFILFSTINKYKTGLAMTCIYMVRMYKGRCQIVGV